MNRISEIPALYDSMMQAEKYYFSAVKPSQLEENLPVVYSITNFKTGVVLYVGKTTRLRRRLYTNHLMGSLNTARLKKYLIDDPETPEVIDVNTAKQYIKNNSYFQFLAEQDMRKRGQLEGLFSFILNVKYVDKEH